MCSCCWACCRCCSREAVQALLGRRGALFAAAYSQLADWQAELVAAGLRHTKISLHQLLSALERLGAAGDCLQLAKLHEQLQPDSMVAHSFALKVKPQLLNPCITDLLTTTYSAEICRMPDCCVGDLNGRFEWQDVMRCSHWQSAGRARAAGDSCCRQCLYGKLICQS
jgi:hypothetical protein